MIQIITDSLCDLTQEQAAVLQVTVLPLYVIFDGKSYLDGITMPREEYYARMEGGKALPTTSQVSPEAFASAFSSALEEGNDVLCITGSSEISGTYQSAIIARDMQITPERVHVLDTYNATNGEALLVREAVRLRGQELSVLDILEKLKVLTPRVHLVGQVENLKHLVRGGRLNATTARIGSLVQLKPILRLKEGKVMQDGLKRGHRAVLRWFCEQLENSDPCYPIYISSANAPDRLATLHSTLVNNGVSEQRIHEMGIGCVIGTHAGTGCLIMSWVEKA